jgi:anti-sigma factor ChrR (cupin superfamily)
MRFGFPVSMPHTLTSNAAGSRAPHTRFNTHSHPGGEEILVLLGLFRDEQGEYPAGTWLRIPRWSRHTPFTA